MKGKKQQSKRIDRSAGRRATVAEVPQRTYWPYFLGGFLTLSVAFWVYGPALYGPFLFDDRTLPFGNGTFPVDEFLPWLKGVRPLVMLSYWMNYRLSQFQPYSYHAFNVIFHAANSILIFLIARKVLQFANVVSARRDVLAVFAGALFLLHPVNSESVAYITSRSEDLSVLLFLGAWTAFLYRPQAETTWARAALVLALFGAAAFTKEHTIVLPAVLLLTDYFWNPPFSFEGIRRNWRMYLPVAAGFALVVAYLVTTLRSAILQGAGGAGFGLKDFTWYQYFFTECRAFWLYIRLFLFPAGLRVDYDFPISRTILEPGALIGLIAILAVAGAAFYYRRRYPLAAFGFFAFVILMAPTSSFMPIKDPVVEYRLYLSMIGLLLIVLEFLRRVDVRQRNWMALLAGVLVVSGIATYERNFVWSDPRILWEDTVAKSPNLSRAEFHLAEAYREQGDCAKALPHYARAAENDPPAKHSYWYASIFVDWGLAYDCLNREDEALAKFRQAAELEPTAHVYSQIGMIYGKQKKNAEAMAALQIALQLDPSFVMTYVYLGGVYQNGGDLADAIDEFKHALALDPKNEAALESLRNAEAALANRR
ncbi:MAG TPA: tetratricopeptide repeat protein [Bryobacteraceae bacterium]|nr:tetratricopeptide repeat protein [Bryobacteraceae bacterium]